MRRVEPDLGRLTVVRVTPAFISLAEAAQALASLEDRVEEPLIRELIVRIAWLCRPTILPGWRWA